MAALKTVLWLEPAACATLADADALSMPTTVFRNGGTGDGGDAVPYVRWERVKAILREHGIVPEAVAARIKNEVVE